MNRKKRKGAHHRKQKERKRWSDWKYIVADETIIDGNGDIVPTDRKRVFLIDPGGTKYNVDDMNQYLLALAYRKCAAARTAVAECVLLKSAGYLAPPFAGWRLN